MRLIRTDETVIGSNTPRRPPSYAVQCAIGGTYEDSLFLSESDLKELQILINRALPLGSTDNAALPSGSPIGCCGTSSALSFEETLPFDDLLGAPQARPDGWDRRLQSR